jgi:hypothetical protein
MRLSISSEQRQALASHPGQPVEIVDEVSKAHYVILPAEHFERVRTLISEEDYDVRESYRAQSDALAAAGWDDPELDVYNDAIKDSPGN